MDGTSASPQQMNAQQRSAHIREVVLAEGVRLRRQHPWLLHQDALGVRQHRPGADRAGLVVDDAVGPREVDGLEDAQRPRGGRHGLAALAVGQFDGLNEEFLDYQALRRHRRAQAHLHVFDLQPHRHASDP